MQKSFQPPPPPSLLPEEGLRQPAAPSPEVKRGAEVAKCQPCCLLAAPHCTHGPRPALSPPGGFVPAPSACGQPGGHLPPGFSLPSPRLGAAPFHILLRGSTCPHAARRASSTAPSAEAAACQRASAKALQHHPQQGQDPWEHRLGGFTPNPSDLKNSTLAQTFWLQSHLRGFREEASGLTQRPPVLAGSGHPCQELGWPAGEGGETLVLPSWSLMLAGAGLCGAGAQSLPPPRHRRPPQPNGATVTHGTPCFGFGLAWKEKGLPSTGNSPWPPTNLQRTPRNPEALDPKG